MLADIEPWGSEQNSRRVQRRSAAALAVGMTPLEIGGDQAGSIRVPSAYCGLFGHKTSETAGPRSGHFPSGRLPNAAFAMATQGPLARSAADLKFLFDAMVGPLLEKMSPGGSICRCSGLAISRTSGSRLLLLRSAAADDGRSPTSAENGD
ncbi:MAG: amidase family protein [Thermomicrobiales bacterium]